LENTIQSIPRGKDRPKTGVWLRSVPNSDILIWMCGRLKELWVRAGRLNKGKGNPAHLRTVR
jgi:Zn-finger nucleic acid-binding protein